MEKRNAGILSVDFYVPPTVVTNQDLIDQYGPFYSGSGRVVDAEGIGEKTGIGQRHVVTDEDNSDLAVEAAIRIIGKTEVPPEKIDCCLLATSTPSMLFPATACLMQNKLRQRFPNILLFPAFDLLSACAGSASGLIIAQALVAAGTCQYVLVLGSEVLTRLCRWKIKGDEVTDGQKQKGDWEDSSLFGDAAGGALVGEVPTPRGFVAVDWGADGSLWEIARSDGFGTQFPGIRDYEPHISLNGYRMYKTAVPAMADAAKRVVEKAGISWEEIQRVLLHQANGLMINDISKRLQKKGLPPDRVTSNIDRYGNTSTASPFILATEEEEAGNIKKRDHVLFSTAGSGVAWAAVLLRW